MPSITLSVKKGSPLHKRIIDEVRRRVRLSERAMQSKRVLWRKADDEIIAYVPESTADYRRRQGRELSGKPAYTTIKIPYTYGVVMSYWTYFCSVFLSRSPIYQFDGAHGETQQQVLMIEALHDYQSRVGRHLANLFHWIYDATRYGVGVVSCYWQQDVRHVTEIQLITDSLTGLVSREQVTRELPGYRGNELTNIQPRDFLPDPRLPISQFQRGEFCGYRAKLSWLQVKQREKYGYYRNSELINRNISPRFLENSDDDSQIEQPDDTFFNSGYNDYTQQERLHPEIVPIYECYIELIPSEWGIGNSDFPEKWVFTVTADWEVVLGAQPHGAYHAKYPFAVLELEPDAYALAGRGVPETLSGVQQTLDWLINSHMYNVRASLNNLLIVDPSRVVMKDLTHGGPGGIVRLRPGGANLPQSPVTQIQIGDITRNHVADFMTFLGIGERTTGVSDQMMGATTRTGRKTATEIRSSNVAGASRQKVHTEYFSATGWGDLGMQLIGNSQQYYDDDLVFKITGNLMQMAGTQSIRISPEDISGAYTFIPVDGSLPIDRFAQANLWKELLLGFERMPAVAMQYDIGRIFAWVAQLSGLRNIDQFRIQMAPNAQLQAQAQQGNVIPLNAAMGSSNPNYLQQPTGGVGPLLAGSAGFGAT